MEEDQKTSYDSADYYGGIEILSAPFISLLTETGCQRRKKRIKCVR